MDTAENQLHAATDRAAFQALYKEFVDERLGYCDQFQGSPPFIQGLRRFIDEALEATVSFAPGTANRIYYTNFVHGAESLEFELSDAAALYVDFYESAGILDATDHSLLLDRNQPWVETVERFARNIGIHISDREIDASGASDFLLTIEGQVARYLAQPNRVVRLTRDLLNLLVDATLMRATNLIAGDVRSNPHSSVPSFLRNSLWGVVLILPVVIGMVERIAIWKSGVGRIKRMNAVRDQLASNGPISAKEILLKIRISEEQGAVWPSVLFLLLDDIAARNDTLYEL